MRRFFFVMSLLALSEASVFAVDGIENTDGLGPEAEQENLDSMSVSVDSQPEESRKRKRGGEDDKPRKRSRTGSDPHLVDYAIDLMSFIEGQSIKEKEKFVVLLNNIDPKTQRSLFSLLNNFRSYKIEKNENLLISDIVFIGLNAHEWTRKSLFTLIDPYGKKSVLKTGFSFVKDEIFPVLHEFSKLDNFYEISYVPFSETPQARYIEHNETILRRIVSELEHRKRINRVFQSLSTVPLFKDLRDLLNMETEWLGYAAQRPALTNVELLFNDSNKVLILNHLKNQDKKDLWRTYHQSIKPKMDSLNNSSKKLFEIVQEILSFICKECSIGQNSNVLSQDVSGFRSVEIFSAPFQPNVCHTGMRCDVPVTTTTSTSAANAVFPVGSAANKSSAGLLPMQGSGFPSVASEQASSTMSIRPNQGAVSCSTSSPLTPEQLRVQNSKIVATELEQIYARYFENYQPEMTPEEVVGLFQGNEKIRIYKGFNAQKVIDLINQNTSLYDENYQKIMEKIEFIVRLECDEKGRKTKEYLLVFMIDISLRLKHHFLNECQKALDAKPTNFIRFVQKHTKQNLSDIHPVLEYINPNDIPLHVQKFTTSELELSEKLVRFLESLESKFQDTPIFMIILDAFVERIKTQNVHFMIPLENSLKEIDASLNVGNEIEYLKKIVWILFHLNPEYENLKRLQNNSANTAFVTVILQKSINEICCKLFNKYGVGLIVESKKKFPSGSIEEFFKVLYTNIENPFDSEGLFQALKEIFEYFPSEIDRKSFVFDNLKKHFNIKEGCNSMYI
jgi:hypothetical protein